MSAETFQLLDRIRRAGKRAVMATLIRTQGTTPRKEGTKMFVGEGGSIFGSVTIGGCVDGRVVEQSHEVLATNSPRLLTMNLGDEEALEIGLACAGSIDLLIEPVTGDVLNAYDEARAEWEKGRAVAMATTVEGTAIGSRTLFKEEGAWPQRSRSFYVEVLRPPMTLAIFGASAVAMPLVALGKTLGLRTMVIDGRDRFANRERFPDADEIRVGIVSEIATQIGLGKTTAVILVAHDHKIEAPVLKIALASDTPYIGLLGSRKRGAAIMQLLRDDGVPDSQLDRIHNPIGLDLGGESAAEIALSILSEVVAVLHGRNGSVPTKREHTLQTT